MGPHDAPCTVHPVARVGLACGPAGTCGPPARCRSHTPLVAHGDRSDWWYTGPFFSFREGEISNVKAVVDWNASNASRLFPHGLRSFSERLGLPLQLYTPFWSDKYPTKYQMVESSIFKGTKLVTPNDSHAFFADLFDQVSQPVSNQVACQRRDLLTD